MVVRGTQIAKAFGHGFQDSFNFNHRFEGISINRARFLFFAVFVAGSFPIFGPVPWTLVLKAWPIRALIPGLAVVPRLPVIPRLTVIPRLPVIAGLTIVPRLPVIPGFSVVPRLPVIAGFTIVPVLPVIAGFTIVPRLPVIAGFTIVPVLPFFPKGTHIARAGTWTLGAIVTKIRGIVIRFG
jgi:hypothetical protein